MESSCARLKWTEVEVSISILYLAHILSLSLMYYLKGKTFSF